MRIAADTNVLLRAVLSDDDAQYDMAIKILKAAELVAISVHVLCEFAWVLDRRYAVSRKDIAAAIRGLADTENVVVNRPAVDAGLAVLDAGGDFADGAIAFDGRWLGGETFASFDKKAVKIVADHVGPAILLA